MKALYDLRDKLCDELDKVAMKRDISAGDLEMAHKLTDTVKNIDKILMLEDEEYSQGGDYSMDGSWRANMEGDYGHGHSYARRRDRMGRYSRDGNSRNYSRDGGYMMGMLEDMLHKADTEKEKEAIRRCMKELRG